MILNNKFIFKIICIPICIPKINLIRLILLNYFSRKLKKRLIEVVNINLLNAIIQNTETLSFYLGFHTWRKDEKLRFHGLDAPEVRGKTRPEGLKSRDWLRSQILNKRTMVQTIKSKTSYAGSTATTLL